MNFFIGRIDATVDCGSIFPGRNRWLGALYRPACRPSQIQNIHPIIKPNQSNQKKRLLKCCNGLRHPGLAQSKCTPKIYLPVFLRLIISSWISMCWRFPPFFMDVQPYIMEDTFPQCGKEIIWMIWKANGIKRRSQRSKSGFMKFPNIFAIRREILFKCCSLRDERQTRRGLKLFLNLISNKIQGELYCFDLNSNAI